MNARGRISRKGHPPFFIFEGISIIIDPERSPWKRLSEELVAIALQTGGTKDRERVVRLLDGGAIVRTVQARILETHSLAGKLRKIEGSSDEKQD